MRKAKLEAMLMRALGPDCLPDLDLDALDFGASMRRNGFDSLTQVAMFSLVEELTGALPASADLSLQHLIDTLDAAGPTTPMSAP